MKTILSTLTLLTSLVPIAAFSQGYGYPAPSSSSSPGVANSYTYKSSQGSYGEYVTDYQGRAIYAYAADTKGDGKSNCYGQCAQAWPPVTIPNGQNPTASGSLQQSYLGKIQRSDGTYQVTYNGWPCYYYAADQGPNDYKGQKVNEYGALWYLLSPDGRWIQ